MQNIIQANLTGRLTPSLITNTSAILRPPVVPLQATPKSSSLTRQATTHWAQHNQKTAATNSPSTEASKQLTALLKTQGTLTFVRGRFLLHKTYIRTVVMALVVRNGFVIAKARWARALTYHTQLRRIACAELNFDFYAKRQRQRRQRCCAALRNICMALALSVANC